jgi:hypothetical protein
MSVSLHCAFFFVPFRFFHYFKLSALLFGAIFKEHRMRHCLVISYIYRAQAKRMLGCLSQSLHKEDIFVPKVCNIIFYLFFINTHSKLTLPQTTGTYTCSTLCTVFTFLCVVYFLLFIYLQNFGFAKIHFKRFSHTLSLRLQRIYLNYFTILCYKFDRFIIFFRYFRSEPDHNFSIHYFNFSYIYSNWTV